MTNNQEKYADKIAALLRKAEGNTTPEEAELLYAKAQELMTKWGIDEAMLAASGKHKSDDEIIREPFNITGIYRFALTDLVCGILRQNNCKMVLLKDAPPVTIDGRVVKQVWRVTATGYKSDIDRCKLLYASLELQAARALLAWWKEHEQDYIYEHNPHRHKRQFVYSFAWAIEAKLQAVKEKAQKAAESEYSGSVALVLRDRFQNVVDRFNDFYPDLRKSKSRVQGGDWASHHAGHAAGQRADTGDPKLTGNRKQIRS